MVKGIYKTWKSKNQGNRRYRMVVGSVTKVEAKACKDREGKLGYYARVVPYKGKWACFSTRGRFFT